MADKMKFAAVPANGDGEPVEVECEFDFGDSLADAQALHSARARIVAGDSTDQVQDAVSNADLSKRGREKMSPLEKLMKQIAKLPAEDQKSVLDSLK